MGTYDISVFPAVDPDEESGEGRTLGHLADPEELIEAAIQQGASLGRWVNFGVLGDEYHDLIEQSC